MYVYVWVSVTVSVCVCVCVGVCVYVCVYVRSDTNEECWDFRENLIKPILHQHSSSADRLT